MVDDHARAHAKDTLGEVFTNTRRGRCGNCCVGKGAGAQWMDSVAGIPDTCEWYGPFGGFETTVICFTS